ncbi:nucleoside hydrolase [Paenibacillus sp. FSL R7-0048]|jgi:pyrimidine-specific ribonucleoside hydrolase|uniref:nucleoside hydrolase n=1 Tax=Paenibacillus TaxID=44249 RepID=UPI00096C413D|nr:MULTISPECIES: nucleoside hydrolase [Paenibacillus]MDH6431092.1 pyrimidine-specific ribonucleoside hydrolase [Paenibacillus sp. PastH-4]MDH6447157.1 pyrimidine-specific ribonucleoside hydrolase [Paenibacillus sp. PastF-4]MDH6531306.1 pyrimidine-specific ribonucleoside hydrolase [Paenibacillus sp. PastH-3]OMC68115.1 pyrimidine-specific ribonucleoside hydrolase RihA [Paenibacillus odorifer]OMC75912.1 pyrimidine-specific ribonucleoside hydrolase RihA [Paenibacillus odorifer]
MPTPIIIDCDPGHDDAIAILLAIANSEKLDLRGITTVGGNQILDKITENALKVISFVNADIPVAKGAAGPLFGKLVTGEEAHGESGMDGPLLPPSKFRPVEQGAVEFMLNIIRSSEEKITLVPMAPLTNIALLITAYPEIKDRIEKISLMGGGISYGNVTSTAEFNIYVDPEAARIVFESGIPITMSGLDVTDKAAIFEDEILALKERGPVSTMVGELLDFYSIYGKKMGYVGSALHDPCAVAWLLHPELFESEHLYVTVETEGKLTRGMTVADRRKKTDRPANVQVLVGVDREAFMKLIFDSLEKLDQELLLAAEGK